jgi:NifU-like protein involved in Fe-S cluster formation
MIDDIYSQKILQYAGNISHIGVLDDADATVERTSRLCGSKLRVYLKLDQDCVQAFSQEVKACALGQASAAIFAQNAVGATSAEIRAARDAMLTMLSGEGEGPVGRFEAARILAPVKDYKSRHGSVMLVFDASVAALDEVRAAKQSLPTVDVGL